MAAWADKHQSRRPRSCSLVLLQSLLTMEALSRTVASACASSLMMPVLDSPSPSSSLLSLPLSRCPPICAQSCMTGMKVNKNASSTCKAQGVTRQAQHEPRGRERTAVNARLLQQLKQRQFSSLLRTPLEHGTSCARMQTLTHPREKWCQLPCCT